MIDVKALSESIEQQIKQTISQNINGYIETIVSELVIDPSWINQIETLVNQTFSQKFSEAISLVDVDSLIVKHIDQGIERWQDRLKQDFATRGIKDLAQERELTVMPGMVVVENDFTTKNLTVVDTAEVQGALIVKDLVLKGSVNVDNASWLELATTVADNALASMTAEWQQTLVSNVLDLAKTQGIDFQEIMINGTPIIGKDGLNPAITKSQISELGVLKHLSVSGEANINSTVYVNNHRMGVNTEKPDMALSVWDEEVTVSLGKLSEKKAFIGTSRLQNFSIGVNRTPYIDINTDGLVTISSLRVGKHRIGHGDNVPGYSGTRGDIVFNTNPREGTPFAWVCLGEFRWQSLKSA